MSESSVQDVKFQDELTEALFHKFVAPRLREHEKAKFVARWKPARAQVITLIAGTICGYGALDFYNTYYVFDTVQAACSNDHMSDCAKFYRASSWLFPVSGLISAITALLGISMLFGWHRQVYAITNQRALTCRIGFPRGFDSFELDGLTFNRSWAGLTVKRGGLQLLYYLDSRTVERAEACLTDARRQLHP